MTIVLNEGIAGQIPVLGVKTTDETVKALLAYKNLIVSHDPTEYGFELSSFEQLTAMDLHLISVHISVAEGFIEHIVFNAHDW